MSDGQSALVNAKLVLLLANHIGDPGVLAEAMAAAREGIGNAGDAGRRLTRQSPLHIRMQR